LTEGESYGGDPGAVNNAGTKHQATGALQFIRVTAEESMQNGCPDPRIGRLEQQVAATACFLKVFHPGTLDLVNQGAVTAAINSISGRWPSVPGGDQQNISFEQFCERFLREGGRSSECGTVAVEPQRPPQEQPVNDNPPPVAYGAPPPQAMAPVSQAPAAPVLPQGPVTDPSILSNYPLGPRQLLSNGPCPQSVPAKGGKGPPFPLASQDPTADGNFNYCSY
jgi:hypothetical protein